MKYINEKIDLGEADKERTLNELYQLKNECEDKIDTLQRDIEKIDKLIDEIKQKDFEFIRLEHRGSSILHLSYLMS